MFEVVRDGRQREREKRRELVEAMFGKLRRKRVYFWSREYWQGEDCKSEIKRFGKLYVAFLGLNYAILYIYISLEI